MNVEQPQWYLKSKKTRQRHEAIDLRFNQLQHPLHFFHPIYIFAWLIQHDVRHKNLLQDASWWNDFLILGKNKKWPKALWVHIVSEWLAMREEKHYLYDDYIYHKEAWNLGLETLKQYALYYQHLNLFVALHSYEPEKLSSLFFEEALEQPMPNNLQLPNISILQCDIEHVLFWNQWLSRYEIFYFQVWQNMLPPIQKHWIDSPPPIGCQPLVYGPT